jgi:N-acetylmuramoyl-L-alanine amidase
MSLPQFMKPSSSPIASALHDVRGGDGRVACGEANPITVHRASRRLVGTVLGGILVTTVAMGTGFAAPKSVATTPSKSAHESTKGGDASTKQSTTKQSTAKKSTAKKSTAKAKSSKKGPLKYKVRSGDTLSSIAVRQDTSIAALLKLNDLTITSVLRVDQSLIVPPRNASSLPARLASNPTRLAVRKHAAIWAKRNGIPQDLLEAMMWQESGFDQTKVSSTGAIGVGQIMPNTGTFIERELIGQDLNPYEMPHNVRMSARYLRYLLKMTGGDSTRALYAYYQGHGSIKARGVYPETVQYARNIQSLRKRFKNA